MSVWIVTGKNGDLIAAFTDGTKAVQFAFRLPKGSMVTPLILDERV
jgi:hypothetical protein